MLWQGTTTAKKCEMLFRMSERNPEATRKAIICAAAAELLERGYAGSSLSQIAGRLNVTKGALAYHFSTKHKLLEAVAAALQESVRATYGQAMKAFPVSGSQHGDVALLRRPSD